LVFGTQVTVTSAKKCAEQSPLLHQPQ